jgi:hypothetical protein
LSHQSLLLVSTYPLAGAWSNKINYLTNISMTAREPLLARRDNARCGPDDDAGACGNDYKRRLLVVDQRDKLGVIVSYDDPEILPTRKPRAVSKALTLDSDVVTARREGGQKRHPQVVIFAADKEQMSPH